jgi:hypothetical protein
MRALLQRNSRGVLEAGMVSMARFGTAGRPKQVTLLPKRHQRAPREPPLLFDSEALARLADMRDPQKWFPSARALGPRQLIMHVGPTNSGKTHHALERLKEAPSGVYLAPLRLLAWEIAERLREGSVPCDLLTGQERELDEGARHISCTVELSSETKAVDVVVIDEVQMIGDRER